MESIEEPPPQERGSDEAEPGIDTRHSAPPPTPQDGVSRPLTRDAAAELIGALMKGVHPRTGEILPEDGPLNDPDVLRALFIALQVLQAEKHSPRARATPNNAGQPWLVEDDRLLLELFDSGSSIGDLALHFQRSLGAIKSRLIRLGRIQPDGLQHVTTEQTRPVTGTTGTSISHRT